MVRLTFNHWINYLSKNYLYFLPKQPKKNLICKFPPVWWWKCWETHNAVNLYTSKDSVRFSDRKVRFVDSVQENLGSREWAKGDESMPLDSCLLFGVCLIMMNIAFHIVRVRINCQYITQSNIINECSIKFQYSYSVNNTTPYTLIVEILRGNRHVAGINFVDGYVGFPPRHGFMISEKKKDQYLWYQHLHKYSHCGRQRCSGPS